METIFSVTMIISIVWMSIGLIQFEKVRDQEKEIEFEDVILAMTFGPLILLTKKKEEK